MEGQQLNSTEGASNMQVMQLFFKWLGVPLAIYKSEGPYAAVWFAELDPANMIVHLYNRLTHPSVTTHITSS